MNDNIDDSNQAPQEPVLNYARPISDMSAGSSRGQGDQALRWQKAQNKFQEMFQEKERRNTLKKDSQVDEALTRSNELLQKELSKIEEKEKELMAQLYRANGGYMKD